MPGITLEQLENRRLAYNAGKRPPYRLRCQYEPCNSYYYAMHRDSRYCCRRHYWNARGRSPIKLCGHCRKKTFAPIVHVKVNGRWVSKEKLWCSEQCRKAAWAYKSRHGHYRGFSIWKFPHKPRYRRMPKPNQKPPKRKPAGKIGRISFF